MKNSEKSQIKKGVYITVSTQYINVIFQVLIGIILARVLSPEEYGIVIKIFVIINFFNIVGNMGIGAAIVQKKDLHEDEKSSFFTFMLLVGVILAILFLLLAKPISVFYQNKVYIKISYFLFLVIILQVVGNVPSSLLRRNKQFLEIGVIAIVANVVSGVIAIILVYKDFSYYALIIQYNIRIFIETVLSILVSKFRVVLNFNFTVIKRVFNYSFYQFINNISNFSSRNIDKILIGKFLGDVTLGLYERAFQLILYPVNQLDRIAGPVLHPILAQYQDEKKIIFNNYINILKILFFISMPLSIYVFCFSKEIILTLYGTNWSGSIPILRALSFMIFLKIVLASTTPIYQATGYTKALFYTNFITNIIVIGLIVLGVYKQNIIFLTVLISIGFSISLLFHYFILIRKIFSESLFSVFRQVYKAILISLILMIVFYLGEGIMIRSMLITLILKTLLFVAIYVFLTILFKEYSNLKRMVF